MSPVLGQGEKDVYIVKAEAANKGDYVACHGRQFLLRQQEELRRSHKCQVHTHQNPFRWKMQHRGGNRYAFQANEPHFERQGYLDWLAVGMGPSADAGFRDEDSRWVHTEHDSQEQFELVPVQWDGKTLYRIQDPFYRRLPKFITRYMLTCRSACRILPQPGASQKASLSEAGTWLVMATKGVMTATIETSKTTSCSCMRATMSTLCLRSAQSSSQ